MNNEINKKEYKSLYPFKGWVLENFPFIEADFDAINNYQLMCKVTEYLNNVIYNQNQVQDLSDELVDGYNDLLEYVNNYFENLDVQDEINQKLDKMAQDGTLKTLVGQYINPYLTQFNSALDEQDATISQIETKVNAITNGSPLVASSTAGMTDTTKTYVNTTDGKWYYYDGDSWEIGGTYQSTGLANGSVGYKNLNYGLNNTIEILEDDILNNNITWHSTNSLNGLVKKDGTTQAAGSNSWGYVTAEVNSPKKVKIFGVMGANNEYFPLVAFFNSTTMSSASLISYIDATADNVNRIIDVDVPNGTLLVAVNSWSMNLKKYPNIGVYSYESNLFDRTFTYEYVETEDTTEGTQGWYKDGTGPFDVHHSLTAPVGFAKKVRVTGSGGGNIPLIVFTDQYGRYISSQVPSTNWIKVTNEADVPVGAYNVVAQDWNNVGMKIELAEETDVTLQELNATVQELVSGSTPSDISFNTENWKQKLIEEQEKNDFAWSSYNKAYITFTFDDLRDDISSIINLFNTKGIKLCLAVPPSRLTANLTGGETGLQACQRTVSAGGEILAHDFDVITSSSTDADYYKHFYTDKKLLVDAGFDVNGVILAGGTNYLTADFDKCVRYMRPYFNYSDLYGYGTGVTQYYHPRTWINSDLDVNKTNIQNAITNKTWLSFASHGTSEVTLELLGNLLDYINTLDSSQVEVVTFKELFDAKGSSKLEERIKNLES